MNPLKIISIIVALMGAGLIGYGIGFKEGVKTKPVTPTPKTIKRCTKESLLKIEYGAKVKKEFTRAEFWDIAGKTELSEGRHKGEDGILMSWFFDYLGEGRYLEIQPCSGNIFRVDSKYIKNNPDQYVITRTKHGNLKLMDMEHDLKKPIFKNIHLFRVHKK